MTRSSGAERRQGEPSSMAFDADFGNTAEDYARHRAGFPDMFFARLAALGVIRRGMRALDVGTGTGTIARGLAERGCAVTALDRAEPMLEQARALAHRAGLDIDFRVGTAERTGLPDAHFDLAVAGQCWHWFDRPAAAAELWRVLRPGATAVIAHLDWLPLPGNVVSATERLIWTYNPAWPAAGGTGLYPGWLTDLRLAGFGGIESGSFDLDLRYSHEAWRGRIRASAGVAASLPPRSVQAFDRALATMLERDFPGDPMAVPHRVWWVIGRKEG